LSGTCSRHPRTRRLRDLLHRRPAGILDAPEGRLHPLVLQCVPPPHDAAAGGQGKHQVGGLPLPRVDLFAGRLASRCAPHGPLAVFRPQGVLPARDPHRALERLDLHHPQQRRPVRGGTAGPDERPRGALPDGPLRAVRNAGPRLADQLEAADRELHGRLPSARCPPWHAWRLDRSR
jgi:hypothetical protein